MSRRSGPNPSPAPPHLLDSASPAGTAQRRCGPNLERNVRGLEQVRPHGPRLPRGEWGNSIPPRNVMSVEAGRIRRAISEDSSGFASGLAKSPASHYRRAPDMAIDTSVLVDREKTGGLSGRNLAARLASAEKQNNRATGPAPPSGRIQTLAKPLPAGSVPGGGYGKNCSGGCESTSSCSPTAS